MNSQRLLGALARAVGVLLDAEFVRVAEIFINSDCEPFSDGPEANALEAISAARDELRAAVGDGE